jgi:hypothetical protein
MHMTRARFEISLNEELLAVAGAERYGVTYVIVQWVGHRDSTEPSGYSRYGLYIHAGGSDEDQTECIHDWVERVLIIGDTLKIKVRRGGNVTKSPYQRGPDDPEAVAQEYLAELGKRLSKLRRSGVQTEYGQDDPDYVRVARILEEIERFRSVVRLAPTISITNDMSSAWALSARRSRRSTRRRVDTAIGVSQSRSTSM